MKNTLVYVFVGKFKDREEACLYSQPQWEPEPNDSVSDAEYSAWENRNPTHKLKDNINSYLDAGFIETIDMDFQYLSSINISSENIDGIKRLAKGANVLVLVYKQALGGFALKAEPVSNSLFTYCGQYECSI